MFGSAASFLARLSSASDSGSKTASAGTCTAYVVRRYAVLDVQAGRHQPYYLVIGVSTSRQLIFCGFTDTPPEQAVLITACICVHAQRQACSALPYQLWAPAPPLGTRLTPPRLLSALSGRETEDGAATAGVCGLCLYLALWSMALVGTLSEFRVASVSLMSFIAAIPITASPVCVLPVV